MNQVIRESKLEREASRFATAKGWFQTKIQKASINGFPDRLFIKDGRTIYVEFKSKSGSLRPEQERVIADMRDKGAEVYVISSMEQFCVIFE